MRFLLGIGYFFAFQFGNGRLVVEAAQLVEDADSLLCIPRLIGVDADSFRIEGPFAFLHGGVFFSVMIDFVQMFFDELDDALTGLDIIAVH